MFTNGTSFTLINNYSLNTQQQATTYTSTGEKVLKFVVTFQDNTNKTTYAKVWVNTNAINTAQRSSASTIETIDADDDLLYKGYDETKTYRGRNEYRILL